MCIQILFLDLLTTSLKQNYTYLWKRLQRKQYKTMLAT